MKANRAHVTEEQLAALVEGGLAGEEARLAKEHLTGCRRCMAAYADAVCLRDSWREDIAEHSMAPLRTRDLAPSGTIHRFRTTRMLLAACLPLLVAAAGWLALRDTGEPAPGDGEILALVARASHHGAVYPGAAGAAWDPRPLTRSAQDTSAGSGLRDLLAELRLADRDSWAALEIAGYLALNDLPMAEIRVEQELDDGNDHPDMFLVAGILNYRQSRLEDAHRYYRLVLAERPDDPEARFNLALLLAEEERFDEARPLLEDLAASASDHLISRRAAQELAKLPDLQPAG